MQYLHPRGEYAARSADKLNYRYPRRGRRELHGPDHAPRLLDSIITMLEQVRGNALLVCDRAVCHVLLVYFDSKHSTTERDSWPNMEVHPGVMGMRHA